MISAKIIAHSKCANTGKEIVTWELVYPRFIHSELMTHRLFSRNAASSRAIPVAKMLEMVRENPAMPVRFGANQAGMQDKGVEHTEHVYIGCPTTARDAWAEAAHCAAYYAEAFSDAGYHKQIANRLIEPYQWMKTVMTATELDNWFWLRDHKDADPTIAALAKCMWEELQKSAPATLSPDEWHVPYYDQGVWKPEHKDTLGWYDKNGASLADALAISTSCCAQVSYRRLDDSLEKAQDIFKRLIESKPCHASPTEHQATPMKKTHTYGQAPDFHPSDKGTCNHPHSPLSWEEGVTHADRRGNLWSGNFKNWIQHRQLIPDNVCWNYVPTGTEETV